ncbi:hypothetical protein J2741_002057 [Methanolinea mesophila]|nr:hypothetical protein [Methanolinea mesophila]
MDANYRRDIKGFWVGFDSLKGFLFRRAVPYADTGVPVVPASATIIMVMDPSPG